MRRVKVLITTRLRNLLHTRRLISVRDYTGGFQNKMSHIGTFEPRDSDIRERISYQDKLEEGLAELQRLEYRRLVQFGRSTIRKVTELDDQRAKIKTEQGTDEKFARKIQIGIVVVIFGSVILEGLLDFKLNQIFYTLFGLLAVVWFVGSTLKDITLSNKAEHLNALIVLLSRDLDIVQLSLGEVLSYSQELRHKDYGLVSMHDSYSELDIKLRSRVYDRLISSVSSI